LLFFLSSHFTLHLTFLYKVFLHEHQQKEFASAIDEIMKELQLKYSNIEINYLKIPIEKQKSTAEIILNQSKRMNVVENDKVFNFFFVLIHFDMKPVKKNQIKFQQLFFLFSDFFSIHLIILI
jgi:hypothetical protein